MEKTNIDQKIIGKENLDISKEKEEQSFDLNDYILQNKIGSGSYGKVYKVKEKKTGLIYAAKIAIEELDENYISDIKTLSREINIISKLNHPSVLRFIGFSPFNFKKKKRPVIITEFASNGSLDHFLSESFAIDTRKLIIIYGISSAMSYLHFHNIIHRDLKSENILLDEFLLPKIADFGLSKVKKESRKQNSQNQIKGTPKYISPEIWEKGEIWKT